MMKKLKNKWLLSGVVLLFVSLFIISPLMTSAADSDEWEYWRQTPVNDPPIPGSPDWIMEELKALLGDKIVWIAQQIIYIIGYIASFLFWLGAQAISFLLSMNRSVLSLPAVTTGWEITRDLANLGFVLAIIVIAFSTIIRYKDYGAKTLLPRLIAAAIIVNFSLTICAVFLNFSDTLTSFFVTRSSPQGDPLGLSTQIANAFSPQRLLNVTSAGKSSITGSTPLFDSAATGLAAVLSVFAAAAFTLLAALTLLAMGIMLLVRLIYIAVLLVLAPIAWLFWIIPDLSGEFKKWWSNFLKWTFYPTILTFFLYLTIVSVEKINTFTGSFQKTINVTKNSVSTPILTDTPFQTIMNMVILVAFLVAGLMIADSMGATGAKTALSLATRAGKGVGEWAGRKTLQAGKNVGRRALAGGVDESGKTRLERLTQTKFGQRLAKIPFVGGAITGVAGASSRARENMKKEVEEREKKYDVRTVDDLNAIATRKISNTPQDDVALMKSIAKKGGWSKLDSATKERLIASAKRLGVGDQITPLLPQLAGEFATINKGDDPAEKRRDAEEKAAARLTEIPKNIDDDFVKFAGRNAQYFSSSMIDQFGTMSGNKGNDVRKAIKGGLEEHTKNIDVKVLDESGKEIEGLSPQRGYEGIKTTRKKIQEHTNKIDAHNADIEELTPKVEEMKAELKERTTRVEKIDSEINELHSRLAAASESEKAAIQNEIRTKMVERDTREKERAESEKSIKEMKDTLAKKQAERRALKHEKIAMQRAIERISELPRDVARAVDSLDKIEKNPAYKNGGNKGTS